MATLGIMSIGTEILRGYTLDTTSNYLENFFTQMGVQTRCTCTADDDIGEITSGLNFLSKCNIIIITGGLGPTPDDVTREAVASFYGRQLIRQESLVEHIKEYFSKRGWEITNSNWKQADLPTGATSLPNDNGTAPGFYLVGENNQVVIVLPGPPSENIPMIHKFIPDILRERGYLNGYLCNKIYKIYNIGESNLADLVKDVNFGNHIVGYYFTTGGWVELHISKFADSPDEQIDKNLLSTIENLFDKNDYFWTDNRSLAEILFELLSKKHLTISFAESLTGGGLSADFTSLPGVSAVHKGGVVSYTNEIKHNVLGVTQETLDKFTEVSDETAAEMVIGVQKLFKSDIAVSLTGIAGPTGGTENKPIGTVHFGFAIKDKIYTKNTCFAGNRKRVINKSINFAYLNVIRFLQGK